jgi:hypothetical protein
LSIVASVMGADYANRRARECGVRQVRVVRHSMRLWTCPHSLRQSALFSNGEPYVIGIIQSFLTCFELAGTKYVDLLSKNYYYL